MHSHVSVAPTIAIGSGVQRNTADRSVGDVTVYGVTKRREPSDDRGMVSKGKHTSEGWNASLCQAMAFVLTNKTLVISRRGRAAKLNSQHTITVLQLITLHTVSKCCSYCPE